MQRPVPDVDASRCAAVAVAAARCRACVDACPREALRFSSLVDADGRSRRTPVVDAAACDGCGLCRSACPSGAIGPVPPMPLRDGADLVVACEAVGPIAGLAPGARVACLHAHGLADLVRWRAAGIERVHVAAVDCAACPRARPPETVMGLTRSVHALATLAESRGLGSPRVVVHPLGAWTKRARTATARADEPAPARRAFLGRLVGLDRTPAAGSAGHCGIGLPLAPAGRAPTTGALVATAPIVDRGRCDGCGTCGRLCPTGALRQTEAGLQIDPTRCIGCGICVDVCDVEAVALEVLTPATARTIGFEAVACGGCGHRLLRRPGSTRATCRVCAMPRRSDRRDRIVVTDDDPRERPRR